VGPQIVREERPLGKGGLRVSAIGLGLMSMSSTYGKSDDAESVAVIQRALDLGITLLDSADIYGWGHNETLLGRALGGRRDGAVLATKFGQVRDPGGANRVNGRPEYVARACDASLGRLGVETIDLYYQHRVDPQVPIEETVGAMSRLVEQGKVRHLGLSEAAPATIRRAHRVWPIAAVQLEYSLLYREEAEAVLPVCRELGIGLVAYAPLGRSLLTGQVTRLEDIPEDDRRRQHPRFEAANLEKNVARVKRVEAMARAKGATTGQLALAWLLARGPDVVPIPGTKRRARLEENAAALAIQLTTDEVRALDEAVPGGAAAGARYPAAEMKAVYL
jgi:aryl-alcohol dehydrogenase-like predicted oxidoreductase